MAQFNSLLVTGNSRFLNPINGNARNGIYYIKGTQTAATGSWTGVIPVPALYDGLTIMYYLPYAGSGNATLNLTLSDGTTTGAVNCYFRKNERLTTHYGSGYNFVLTYHSAGSIAIDGTATTDNRWVVTANYTDGNDTSYYDRIIYVRATAGSNKVFPYTLVMRLPDGRWESIVTSSSTGTGKTRNTHGFLFGQLAYIGYNETFAENALISDYRLWTRYTNVVDYRYSFNLVNNTTQGFTANKPIYLVGSIGSDGLFYIDANMWAKALPSSADGKIYMYIGDGFDWYRATFFGTNSFKAYVYTNGHIREYNQDAATVGGHTVAKDVPSNALFTDNNTTYTFANGTNGFTVTPSGGTAQTVTVTPSITNNVTGSGTSGYLAKFNGKNTITNAVALGSDTTKYLRNDGTWQVPTGTTYSQGTGISISGTTINHSNSITAGTAGTSSATSGSTLAVPYVTYDAQGHVTASGTHTHTVTGFATTDTKNTAGSTNTSSKIYLIGATSQAANPQTYSNSGVFVSGSGEFSSHTWSVKNGNLYARAECYVDAEDGGRLNIYDKNGIGRMMLIGNSGLTLNDSTDTTTIFLDSDNGRVECEKMSYVNKAVTFSKSSGSWTYAEGEYTRSGQVVQVVVQFKGGGSNVSVGSNAIAGTINGLPNPPRTIRLQGYYSGTVLMGELTASGGFNVRILGQALNLSSSNKATLSGTYIVED